MDQILKECSYYGDFNSVFTFRDYNIWTFNIVKNENGTFSFINEQISVGTKKYVFEEIQENAVYQKTVWNYCLKIKFLDKSEKCTRFTLYFDYLNSNWTIWQKYLLALKNKDEASNDIEFWNYAV